MTAALNRFTAGNASSSSGSAKIPLSLEGPYGVATRFPALSSGEFDRILLIAGGVGATFTVPLYRAITNENPNARIEMVWAVRDAGEATWAVLNAEAGGSVKSILEDENVHIFLTGDALGDSSNGNGSGARNGAVEMSPINRDRRRGRLAVQHDRKRPDLKKIVEGVFAHGAEERVAVLVCGPEEMAQELRRHVGVWVGKGRMVWWHKEGFGF